MNKMKFIPRIAAVAAAALISLVSFAQSAGMLSMARAELQKRGLTEMEVRSRLLSKGINVDSIPPSDYPRYQSQVMAAIAELEAEKNGGGAVAGSFGSSVVADTLVAAPVAPLTTQAEVEAQQQNTEMLNNYQAPTTDIYGHSLFSSNALDVFRTTDGARAPETYVLGEGDEIHISIFGASQVEMQYRINSDGYIQPTGAGKIFLKGMTIAQARQAIANNMSSYYSFRKDQIAVTIITARTVLVNIFGEVNVAGGYTVSALNNAFNAITAAGGLTEIASVRGIQLIRGKEKRELDLYAFMQDPTGKVKLDIQNNDIIYVPTAKCVVRVEGGVQRPMRYEMLEGENVQDLIKFAGGLNADADMNFLQVERFIGGEKKYLEFTLSGIMDGSQKVALQNGDVVRMRAMNKPMESFVRIQGGVYYEGNYDFDSNRSLRGLIEKSAPKFTAKTDYVFVERTRDDRTIEVLTVPYPGVNGNPDFALREMDIVTVLDKADYRDVANIEVRGQVRKPFVKEFSLNDKMTVSQAIEYAGGLRESVYPVAYIYRQDQKNPRKMEYLSIDLVKEGNAPLMPGDVLNVYDNTTYTNIGELSITGAVKNAQTLTFNSDVTFRDLMAMAGGIETGADLNRIEVFRLNLDNTETEIDRITVVADSMYNVISPVGFTLCPFDKVVVRVKPEYGQGRSVQISGRVRYPGAYVIENTSTTLVDLIEMAGGLLPDADPYGAKLYRTFRGRGYVSLNLKDANARKNSVVSNPIMMEDDVVDIQRLENIVTIYPTGTRMSQYVAEGYADSLAVKNMIADYLQQVDTLGQFSYLQDSLSTQVQARKVITFDGRHNAAWYVRNYAGGFAKNSDKNSVTVTYPNNQMVGTKRVLGMFRRYPVVQPGSAITLVMNPEKVRKEKEPKDKIDIESTLAKGISTITSTVSLIILLQRL